MDFGKTTTGIIGTGVSRMSLRALERLQTCPVVQNWPKPNIGTESAIGNSISPGNGWRIIGPVLSCGRSCVRSYSPSRLTYLPLREISADRERPSVAAVSMPRDSATARCSPVQRKAPVTPARSAAVALNSVAPKGEISQPSDPIIKSKSGSGFSASGFLRSGGKPILSRMPASASHPRRTSQRIYFGSFVC